MRVVRCCMVSIVHRSVPTRHSCVAGYRRRNFFTTFDTNAPPMVMSSCGAYCCASPEGIAPSVRSIAEINRSSCRLEMVSVRIATLLRRAIFDNTSLSCGDG